MGDYAVWPLLVGVLLVGAPFGQEPTGQEILPGDPFERLGEALRAELAGLDPLSGGWMSEASAKAASRQLDRVAGFLEKPGLDPERALAGVFAEGFVFSGPAAPEEVYAESGFRVFRPSATSPDVETTDRDGFLALLRRSLQGARGIRAHFKLIGIEGPPEGFATRSLLALAGTGPRGGFQLGLWWQCSWSQDTDAGAPLLHAVKTLGYERVSAPASVEPLLSDQSGAVFGGVPAYAEQLVSGLSSWRTRLDTRLGVPLLGHSAGLAIGDVDGDGLEDLYLCQPGGLPNKLFLHRPDGTLEDHSSAAGVDFLDFSRAALLIDLDNDGDRDLAVNTAERLLLLANDGRARFWLQAALPATDATSLAAADVDLDGDLDLYVCAYASPYDHSALPLPYHDARNGKPNLFLENHGDWIFVEANEERGFDQNNNRFSFAASFEDYDLDGDPDLYVANDFGRNNLYRNDGGRFVDVAAEAGVEDISAGMGVTWGDYDGDGRFDLYVSNMYSSAGNRIAYQRQFQSEAGESVLGQYQRHAHGNTLFRNLGGDRFLDVTNSQNPLGIAMGRWAWGALFADLNQDGWLDLLSPNGFLTEEKDDDL